MRTAVPRLITVILFAASGYAAAAEVGRVLLAAGDTVAVRGVQTVKLTFGSTIQDRDVLRTGPASNLQVRFTDESIVSMRESSELRIDEFRFAGREDGSERAFFRLLKGGLRAVTGLIGRTNNKNYSLSTITATIGIRGTDYATALCQQDCRNNDGTLARDGLYGRVLGVSYGTNRIEVSNERDQRAFGINENFYVADAKSLVEPLLVPPDFVSNRLEGRKQGGTRDTAAGTGKEQAAASSGAQAESRLATPPPPPPELQFVATEQLTTAGTPAVISGAPTIAGVGALFDSLGFSGEPGDGGGFFAPSNVTLSGTGTSTVLLGFTLPAGFSVEPGGGSFATTASSSGTVINETVPNSLNANWGRWTGGSMTELDATPSPIPVSSTNQFHYLFGPLTPPEVVAAKTGSFLLSMVQGTTPTNQLGQTGTFSILPSSVDFTARTVTFGPTSFVFPSDSWLFPGGTTPIQFAAGKGAFIDQVVSGSCSGSTCTTSTPAVLGKTGIFMGPAGDHLGVAFQARTTSGPTAYAQTVKLFTCAPSC